MNRARLILMAAAALAAIALPARGAQFKAYDVVVDPHGQKLAAYQIEITADHAGARIVGVEGGEHRAFAKAPYYDPAALQSGRVVIAAFSTESDLPSQATRIATLHMVEPDACDCRYTAKSIVATDSDGHEIEISARLVAVDGGTR